MSVKEGQSVNKFKRLINSVSHNVYEYIENVGTYSKAMEVLHSLYVKTPNVIFARHLLAPAKKQPVQSIDEFLQTLRNLSEDCNFKDVSAAQYGDELIRDSFINGILSNNIRQRLLENKDLTLELAFSQASSFDLAQRNSPAYEASRIDELQLSASATSETSFNNEEIVTGRITGRKCIFCGYNYHNRQNCPASNASCYECDKKGRFAKVCRSKMNKPGNFPSITASASSSVDDVQSAPRCLLLATLPAAIAGRNITALIDNGSSLFFINEKTARMLRLKVLLSWENVVMAVQHLQGTTIGSCLIDLIIGTRSYTKVPLKVFQGLCCDLLLCQDFQRQYERVVAFFF
uniref:uncharacterized protein LOC120340078 n=1 Tax=Styela clava TaxID=7725 RepID=UPI00193A0F71|nr:uncharacterized protein LOC120340078 [Styela clava]